MVSLQLMTAHPVLTNEGEYMKIEMEKHEYQYAISSVEKVLDDALDRIDCEEKIKDHILAYAADCVDAVWDAIN